MNEEKSKDVTILEKTEMVDESGSASLWSSGTILPSFVIFHRELTE